MQHRSDQSHAPAEPAHQPVRRQTQSDAAFDVVVVATSLGGRSALEQLLAPLPPDFPVPVMVVHHVDARSPSLLPELLAERTAVAVKHAEDGECLSPATVYVAPPGRHLLVNAERRCVLSDSPPVWFARPAADPLFLSAAAVFGARALGVILTGKLCDGADGAVAIRNAGGVVLAQDPATCRAPGMPRAAIERGGAHLSLPLAALSTAVTALVNVRGASVLFGLQSRAS